MKLYGIIIGMANIIIIIINFLLQKNILSCVCQSVFSTIFVIVLDGVSAFLIRKLPEKIFSPENLILSANKTERNFYKKMGIKNWKTKIPELGGFTNFHKDKIESKTDIKYLYRFLLEINYGVVIHIQNAFFGFLTMLLPFSISITLPVAIVNFVLSLMAMAVLRYNATALCGLYKKAKNCYSSLVLN